ncbi:unnamed protein product [Paramecium sonneborni]|uniref:Uncharacterized protein n=1 Tax=Paramecium sonneborni TaxID=65129 RepID=A0A8S1LDK1_9CILI|nr:unnamed protein product [Paramecium sonneborni]
MKNKYFNQNNNRNSELSFIKFRPIQKLLNLLRICAELKISDRISKSVEFDKVIESKPFSTKSNRTKHSSSQYFDHSVHVQQFKDETTPKQRRRTLKFLSSQQLFIKTTIPPQIKPEKKSNLSSVNTQSPRQKISVRKLPLNELESKLEHLKSNFQDPNLQTRILCKVPSQILIRNGILLLTQKNQFKYHNVKNVWKMIIHHQLLIQNQNQILSIIILNISNKNHKNYEHKKVEYRQESIKLFYQKIYSKI